MGVMGLEATALIITLLGGSLIATTCILCRMNIKQQATIDRQNDTIQRLISREPVTYQETGQAPQKPSKEIYAAWGSQMVDLDKDT